MELVFNYNEENENVLKFIRTEKETIKWRIRGEDLKNHISIGELGVIKTGRKVKETAPGYHTIVKVIGFDFSDVNNSYVEIENFFVKENLVVFKEIKNKKIIDYYERTKYYQNPIFKIENDVFEEIIKPYREIIKKLKNKI